MRTGHRRARSHVRTTTADCMATFSIENFGCRTTEADTASLRRRLLASGLALAPDAFSADVVVLNTCTVTAAADSQAREAVRKIRRANPAARIVVTGCYAQRAPEELAAADGVAWVIGNSRQEELPAVVRELVAPEQIAAAKRTASQAAPDFVPCAVLEGEGISVAKSSARILTSNIFASVTLTSVAASADASPLEDRTRPILKIQDGCNNACSFCVIPAVRGHSRSLPPDAVVSEVRELVAGGAREIVLSGINLGSYGRDLRPRADLAGVAQRILRETDLEQLRFSSIEPQDITEDFVALAAASGRLARHFHVPLQSGSDRILRAMHRWYRAGHYAERVQLIRRLLPDAAIGADVIVGFPGEMDADFEATADFVARQPLTYLHVFSFSARPGTRAAGRSDTVPAAVVRQRARALRALAQEKSAAFRASLAGSTLRALTLRHGGDGWTEALTGNYLKLRIAGQHPANEWREVCISAGAEEPLDTTPA